MLTENGVTIATAKRITAVLGLITISGCSLDQKYRRYLYLRLYRVSRVTILGNIARY
jgi:hypothetical protein